MALVQTLGVSCDAGGPFRLQEPVLKPGGRAYFDNIDLTSNTGWAIFMDSAAYPPQQRPAFIPMTSTAEELRTYAVRAGFADVATHRWDDAWVAVTARKPITARAAAQEPPRENRRPRTDDPQ